MNTKEYKFTITIDDGYATFQTVLQSPDGYRSVSDLIRAIKDTYPELQQIGDVKFLCALTCPSPTQSSPSSPLTVPAQSAAGPAIPTTGAPPAEFGRLSTEQLRHLDAFLLGEPYHLSGPAITGALHLLWKIVRPGAMKAAGISSCDLTRQPSSSANND